MEAEQETMRRQKVGTKRRKNGKMKRKFIKKQNLANLLAVWKQMKKKSCLEFLRKRPKYQGIELKSMKMVKQEKTWKNQVS